MRARTAWLVVLVPFLQLAHASPTNLQEFAHPGFVLFEVDSPRNDTVIEVIMRYDGPAMGALAVLDANETAIMTGRLWGTGGLSGAEARIDGNSHRAFARPHDTSGWLTALYFPQGVHRGIFMAAGSVPFWSYSIRELPDGATWRVVAAGPSYARLASEFEQGDAIGAYAEAAGAWAARGAAIDLTVEHRLFGNFAAHPSFAGYTTGARVVGADRTDDCPCEFLGGGRPFQLERPLGSTPPDRLPPAGAYRFEWTGGMVSSQQVPLAAWADVPLDR